MDTKKNICNNVMGSLPLLNFKAKAVSKQFSFLYKNLQFHNVLFTLLELNVLEDVFEKQPCMIEQWG